MNKFFYQKLAWINLKKNASTYIPYLLTCISSVMGFYMMASISKNPGLDGMVGSENLKTILLMGTVFIGIFSVIFLFYTHSFLIKRRKKEIALYSILGLEKKHIAQVLFYESLIVGVITLVLGLSLGLLLSKLMFWILLNFLKRSTDLTFEISISSMLTTLLLFGAIFIGIFIKNFLQVSLVNPINLLQGEKEGEREPKTSWILTIIGIFALGTGYFIALTVKSPLSALTSFFLAVICVVIGTYALFISGSIALLKALKKNKRFFYQSKNFISVSSMIYRMKQNAVGLGSICILCTMVLVSVSTTVALYIGQEDMLKQRFPYEFEFLAPEASLDKEGLKRKIDEEAKKNAVEINKENEMTYYLLTAIEEQDQLRAIKKEDEKDEDNPSFYEKIRTVYILSLDDYNRLENKNESLESDQALIFSNSKNYGKETLNLGDQSYQIKEELETFSLEKKSKNNMSLNYYIVVNSLEKIQETLKNFQSFLDKEAIERQYALRFDLKGDELAKTQFCTTLSNESNIRLNSVYEVKESLSSIFGGFLFIGIFLGALFVMATTLIIYFKQISEGYDDHDRFEVMQKVGMDKKEIKKTIQNQILMVFFLPLITAMIHVAVALPIIIKLLAAFNLTNIHLILLCTGTTALIFSVLYGSVYLLTARVYYQLVQ